MGASGDVRAGVEARPYKACGGVGAYNRRWCVTGVWIALAGEREGEDALPYGAWSEVGVCIPRWISSTVETNGCRGGRPRPPLRGIRIQRGCV